MNDMKLFRVKSWFSLAFVAAALFLAVSLGGEIAHKKIHHHADQKEQSDCAFYQLSAQALFFAVVAVFTAPVFRPHDIVVTREVYPSSIWRAFASPRAPPLARP